MGDQRGGDQGLHRAGLVESWIHGEGVHVLPAHDTGAPELHTIPQVPYGLDESEMEKTR